MTRWDYDTVFYRMFCTALLGVALTFTIILTNVFIDIDGLLYKKNGANTNKQESVQVREDITTKGFIPEAVYDDKDYGDSSTVERTKRSMETQDFSFKIKDPKMKKVITNRLAELLEDLDKEESSKNNQEVINKSINEHHPKMTDKSVKYTDVKDSMNEKKNNRKYKAYDVELFDGKTSQEDLGNNLEIMDDIKRKKNEKDKKQKYNRTEDELKHLAMHNIILQGIIGHMDLGEVYAKVHALIHNLETPEVSKDNLKGNIHPAQDKQFFNELMNCKQLKEQIVAETAKPEIKKLTTNPSGRNVMIKTIIDITSLANDKTNQDDVYSKENINGIIKLIYNGKLLKFRRVDEDTTTAKAMLFRHTNEKMPADIRVDTGYGEIIKEAEEKILDTDKSRNPHTYVPNIYINTMINEYLKILSKESENLENIKKMTTKRLKRHIKIQYENEETAKTTSEIPKVKGKKEDDELFVEIETHFDSKGLKGEKKKKMIRDLIEKIQRAIHSEKEVKKKKHKHLHVKKRTQNPLDSENTATFVNKILMPLNSLVHRNIDPISKSVPFHEKLPYVSDSKGDYWRTDYYGPRFLTVSKAINSAEISEVDTDYNRIKDNGIPQRLQKPLNTDSNDETLNFNNVQDQGNAKFTVKNIAGSGFSIGFNQYVDEPPDAESMKLFTGIENIIQTYHQKYDEDTNAATTYQENPSNQAYQENQDDPTYQEYLSPKRDEHLIVRRSIKNMKRDYHSNEYKVVFNKNHLNLNNYQDVYNSKGHYSASKNIKAKDANLALVIDDNIFNKNLKPAEIFSMADILERQKRSLNVKKISNMKNKKVLNRYLNTKSMASKKIFQQNKRSKRQINKIRIIAKDLPNNHGHNTEEEIFVLSDEKIFADRAMVKEVEIPDMEPSKRTNEEHYDVIAPQKPAEEHFDIITPERVSEDHYDIISPQQETENHYDIISPYVYEATQLENNVFTRRSRHNSLMSKYPHIFMEEIARSKEEDFIPKSPVIYGKMRDMFPVKVEVTTPIAQTIVEMPESQFIPQTNFNNPVNKEIDDRYPSSEKGNYKVTVKIMPKNNTGLSSGIKEIHTSINKSYNKNGLVYTSLVNVSEISKVEKINKTKGNHELAYPSVNRLKKEQLKIKSLIQQHKDRIEEQLAHLKREKEKLDRIDTRNTEFLKDHPKDYIDVPLPMTPARTLHLTKEDLGQFFNFEETTTIEETTTTKQRTPTKHPTTTIPTITNHEAPTTEDPGKVKIMETIERNEVVTNEILKKIDKNTDILQTLLDKLMSKIEMPRETTKKPEEYHNTQELVCKNANNYEGTLNHPQQVPRTNEIYDQSIQNLIFNPMPNEAQRNGSVGIPFIYAFQHPNMMPNSDNKDVPIASVVYQGHIHTNTVNVRPDNDDRRNWKEKVTSEMKEKVKWRSGTKPVVKNNFGANNSSSKFFIDDLENDYKVLPVVAKTVFPSNLTMSTKV